MTANSVDPLAPVLNPIESAQGLPNEHYTSDAVFREESQALLFDNWAGIGFDCDVPNNGDVKPLSLLGVPLLLARDHEGRVRVYQNTCRHRGMILVQEPKKVHRVIRCPYHSWCYGLDGKLAATPHVGGAGVDCHASVNRDELGLVEFPARVWLGVVFVNISGNAAPFDRYAQALLERWHEFDRPVFGNAADSTFQLTVNTNWKLAVENYCESYHLPSIHPGLNSYSRLEDHYNIEHSGHFSGQGSEVYRQLVNDQQQVLPDFDALGDKWNTGAEYIALFPNVLLGVHRDHTFALVLEPVATDRTIEHVALFYTEAGATDSQYQSIRADNAHLWKGVFEEDIGVVEGMQLGRHGPQFDGGRFSAVMDGPTHVFHQWVAASIQQHRANVSPK